MVRVSGSTGDPLGTRSSPDTIGGADPMSTQLTAEDFGADDATMAKRYKSALSAGTMTIGNGDRPTNIWLKMNQQSMYWRMYYLMDYYRSEVSALSTIINRAVQELFRYDLELRPKFALKCVDCGYESQTLIDTCPACGKHRLRRPDPSQRDYFRRPNGKSFIDEANDSGQPLREVLMAFADSELQNNQGYLLCVTGDVYNKQTGHLERAYPLEFLAYDPKFVKNLFDDSGKQGTMYGFVRSDRNSIISLDPSDEKFSAYSRSGEEIYPAAWQIGENYGGDGKYWLYTREEVYQAHWMRAALTYGVPIWLDIEDDLLTYHFQEKHTLKLYKYGYLRKILVLPGFNDTDAEAITSGIQDILAKNDNSIPIVCLPPQATGVAEMRAQTLELGTESIQDLLASKDDIRNRVCAMGGMPNLFAGDVEASGGMNNESQQITIFDRFLLGRYNDLDRACDWVTSWVAEKMTDWELRVMRPSKAYTDVKRLMDRTQEAQLMKQEGYDQEFRYGQFYYTEEPVDQIQRKEQEQMAKQQQAMMMQQQSRGLLPGDGDGPPEKGTARREDPDIDANKDDIDLSKREAEENSAL